MKKAYAFLATGFEEVEALAVIDVLIRAGVEVTMVSISDDKKVTGSHNISIMADALFADIKDSDADLYFLPGGMPGTTNLEAHEELCKLLVDKFNEVSNNFAISSEGIGVVLQKSAATMDLKAIEGSLLPLWGVHFLHKVP